MECTLSRRPGWSPFVLEAFLPQNTTLPTVFCSQQVCLPLPSLPFLLLTLHLAAIHDPLGTQQTESTKQQQIPLFYMQILPPVVVTSSSKATLNFSGQRSSAVPQRATGNHHYLSCLKPFWTISVTTLANS